MVYVTRVEHFNAAHKLWNKNWSAEENKAFFGKCANENFHGHNYELHVTVKGETNPESGFVLNAQDLSRIIKKYIVDEADHRNLNIDVPFMEGKLTSAENFTTTIWEEIKGPIEELGVQLHCVKLIETPKIYIEYYG